MQFASIRIITADVERLTGFYERLTGLAADRLTPVFAELRAASGTIAIGGEPTVALFGAGSAEPAANRSVIIEFRVDDVDATAATLRPWVSRFEQEPTTMPWGNRSLLLRDPDGNLVNVFAPVTPEAVARFS